MRWRDASAPSFDGCGRDMRTRQKLLKYKEITPSAQQTVAISGMNELCDSEPMD
jgi:hypothetical protein